MAHSASVVLIQYSSICLIDIAIADKNLCAMS
jgi:hypothetical protein